MATALKTAGRAITIGGSHPKGKARQMAPRARKQLTRSEKRQPKGRFAVHFNGLLEERGWTVADFSQRSGINEHAIRKWLRAESVPETLDLEKIGAALDDPAHPFPDYRLILPPSKA